MKVVYLKKGFIMKKFIIGMAIVMSISMVGCSDPKEDYGTMYYETDSFAVSVKKMDTKDELYWVYNLERNEEGEWDWTHRDTAEPDEIDHYVGLDIKIHNEMYEDYAY